MNTRYSEEGRTASPATPWPPTAAVAARSAPSAARQPKSRSDATNNTSPSRAAIVDVLPGLDGLAAVCGPAWAEALWPVHCHTRPKRTPSNPPNAIGRQTAGNTIAAAPKMPNSTANIAYPRCPVGQTFLSASLFPFRLVDRNVCPTEINVCATTMRNTNAPSSGIDVPRTNPRLAGVAAGRSVCQTVQPGAPSDPSAGQIANLSHGS